MNALIPNSQKAEVAPHVPLEPTKAPAPNPIRRFPAGIRTTEKAIARRWTHLSPTQSAHLVTPHDLSQARSYQNNIENFVGTVKVPLGIAGPLRVRGNHADGEFHVPLATTEAALVASYHRGANLITAAGGAAATILDEGISRTPAFAFTDLQTAAQFVPWILNQIEILDQIIGRTSAHTVLKNIGASVEGNHVYLDLKFTTGDAAGQNMVTLATQKICDFIRASAPNAPLRTYVEGNLSGDKKASARAFCSVRGKKVSAEITLPAPLVDSHLHTTPEAMGDYWRMSTVGAQLSGTMGAQGQFANGLAALYIATGQDAACVAESAVGITRFEVTDKGDLYAAVTLPNIILGTVGGGTELPSQKAALDILGLAGDGGAAPFAEIAAALVLAGELSIIGALAAGHFARAHQKRRPQKAR